MNELNITNDDTTRSESNEEALNSTRTSIRTSWEHYIRPIQNFRLIWLDSSIDEDNNDGSFDTDTLLRQVINAAKKFTDIDECVDFITDIEDEKIFLVVSGICSQTIVSITHDMAQLHCIYILCEHRGQDEQWTEEWLKVKGVYTDITSICESLKQAVQECDRNSVSMTFASSTNGTSNENLDQLNQSFMYTQLLKEILLTIDFQQGHINEYLMYCREQFTGNTSQLKNVDKFEKEYCNHSSVWWYTNEYFLYSMLNRALRMMEVDLIIKMGFFVQNLHHGITALHSEQYDGQPYLESFIVYRGQGLSRTDFDHLVKTKGGLMSFNNFLSTSLDREVSRAFAESNQYDPDLIGILFEITVNPSTSSTSFANVHSISAYHTEEEILFSTHSIFRIGQIKQIDGNDRFWQVDLTLTSDNDPQLHALTERMREETIAGHEGWYRLGYLMIKLGHFSKAEELYETLLKQTTYTDEKTYLYQMLGFVKNGEGNCTEAVAFYKKALEIYQNTLPLDHRDLAFFYNNIGIVYNNMGEYPQALSCYEKALEIWQKTLPVNHPDLASSYNNIGSVYNNMTEYSKALSYYEKALEIWQKTLPPNHPSLAISYNNIGLVYNNTGEYSKALSSHEKALEIHQKTLPTNHPHLARSYFYHGSIYDKMGEYSKALLYYDKALGIHQETRPPNYPELAVTYNNIGTVYYNMNEHSKALSYYRRALEIGQKLLSTNDSSLTTSYNSISNVYNRMGEYSKALSYYEKALEIRQKTLTENHPDLATCYNNIGNVSGYMNEYSKALSYYEKALEIFQKTLPANHPNLSTSYSNIGLMYKKMGEYSKALLYHEKDLEIQQKILPANHPYLATSYDNIGNVYNNTGEYSKALSYYEKALEIWQTNLPTNHPDLAISYNNIGTMYYNMSEYSKALSYYEQALEIDKKTLPPNHPDLADSYNNIGLVYRSMDEYSKTLGYYERALNIWQHSLSPDHPSIENVRRNIEIVKKKL